MKASGVGVALIGNRERCRHNIARMGIQVAQIVRTLGQVRLAWPCHRDGLGVFVVRLAAFRNHSGRVGQDLERVRPGTQRPDVVVTHRGVSTHA